MQKTLSDNNRYAFADGLRGIAALWVVLYHLFHGKHIQLLSEAIGHSLSTIIFEHGNLGVPIFFVLSGFVMAVTTNSKHMYFKHTVMFMCRRLIRLSPPYYFSILLALSILLIKIKTVNPYLELPDLKSLIAHIFYFQEILKIPEINIIYWTLCIEIQFYLVFCFVIYIMNTQRSNANKQIVTILLISLIGVVWLAFKPFQASINQYIPTHSLFIDYWYAFCAGALIGWTINRSQVLFKNYVIAYSGFIAIYGILANDLFALTSGVIALLIYIALSYNKMGVWLNYKTVQFLGMVSYSLYLTHNILTGSIAIFIRKIFSASIMTDITLTISTIAICVICSYLMYLFIEKPVIKLSQLLKY